DQFEQRRLPRAARPGQEDELAFLDVEGHVVECGRIPIEALSDVIKMDHGALILTRFLLICLGGAAGTAARYLTALWASAAFAPAFPAGTLIVNVAGSFLLGFLMGVSPLFSANVRLMLTTGVMGGFTTYST